MNKTIDLKALLESKMGAVQPVPEAEKAIERAEVSIPRNLLFSAEATDIEFVSAAEPVAGIVARSLTVEEAQEFNANMSRFVETVLVAGTDYGIIPRCSKPSLLKPGAEKVLHYLGLVARTVVTSRMEDFNDSGFFSYECRVTILDGNGAVKAEGFGCCSTKEPKYIKSSGFASMNTVLKMAKKRALVDAVLNVACLSGFFTQDLEDILDGNGGNDQQTKQEQPRTDKPASAKQIAFLEKLMQEANATPAALNRRVKQLYNIDDYHNVTSAIASELIQKFQAAAQR